MAFEDLKICGIPCPKCGSEDIGCAFKQQGEIERRWHDAYDGLIGWVLAHAKEKTAAMLKKTEFRSARKSAIWRRSGTKKGLRKKICLN